MIEKLRSHLRKAKGFTLIELLIVIAIIAILVIIAIVAINPVERIRDANDEKANSNVRSTTAAVQACLTKELAKDPTATVVGKCGSWDLLVTGKYVSGVKPTGLDIITDGTSDTVCDFQQGGHDGSDAGNTTPDLAGGQSNGTQIWEVGDTGSVIGNSQACPMVVPAATP